MHLSSKFKTWGGALSLSTLQILVSQCALASEPITVAVFPLENRGRSNYSGGSGPDVGMEAAKLLAKQISEMPNYKAFAVDVSADANSRFPAPDKVIAIGRKEHADYVLLGTVAQLEFVLNSAANGGRSMNTASFSRVPYGGAIGGVLGAMQASVANMGKVKALFETKLISVATGNVVSAVGGAGASKRMTTALWDSRQNFADFSSAGFAKTSAGEAILSGLDPIKNQFRDDNQKLTDMADSFRVKGAVQDIDDQLICIDSGKVEGIIVGTKLNVERPITNEKASLLVGSGLTNPVGVIIVSDVGDHSSLGKVSDGQQPSVGDFVRQITGSTVGSYEPTISQEMVNGRVAPSSDSFAAGNSNSMRSSTLRRLSSPSSEQWKRLRDLGVEAMSKQNYTSAQSYFTSALRYHPPTEAFQEITGYLSEINEKTR